MRLSAVFNYAKEYLMLGILTVILLAVIFCMGYFLIYRLIMKGQKKPSKKYIFLSIISFCYIVVVLGAVFLTRGDHSGTYILQPFYSYKLAWNEWSTYGWRNIILNIVLFVPFGFLLPLWSEKLQRLWRVAGIGFFFTLFIETTQFLAKRGIFEVDDLIDNTLGVLIGYGVAMILVALTTKKKLSLGRIVAYLTPALVTAAAFATIFLCYAMKDIGNMTCAYSYPVNMKQVSLITDLIFDNEGKTAMAYKTSNAIPSEAEAFAATFFEKIGTRIDRSQNDIYDESGGFYSEGRSYSVWVSYRGFTYSFTDYSHFDKSIEEVTDADEETVRAELAKMGIEVPEAAKFYFSHSNKGYVFEAEMADWNGSLINGNLNCRLYNDGTIKKLNNSISFFEPYKEFEIISELEAFAMLKRGQFTWWYGPNERASSMSVHSVSLVYQLDSKGYYQPVYAFSVTLDGYDAVIRIPAIR